jgi:hypothetical protein
VPERRSLLKPRKLGYLGSTVEPSRSRVAEPRPQSATVASYRVFRIRSAATNSYRKQTVLTPKLVDGVHTRLTMLSGHFVETVQQGKNLLRFDPVPSHFLRHVTALIQLRHQPLSEWLPPCGPGHASTFALLLAMLDTPEIYFGTDEKHEICCRDLLRPSSGAIPEVEQYCTDRLRHRSRPRAGDWRRLIPGPRAPANRGCS